jgi:putative membrane protein
MSDRKPAERQAAVSSRRAPVAFPLAAQLRPQPEQGLAGAQPDAVHPNPQNAEARRPSQAAAARKPASIKPSQIIETDDHFAQGIDDAVEPGPTPPAPRRFPLGATFASLAASLLLLWLGTSAWGWITGLISANPALGWVAAVLAGLSLLAFLALLLREISGMMRLGGNNRVRQAFEQAAISGEKGLAVAAISGLESIAARLPASAGGLAAFRKVDRNFLSASDLMSLAERDILAALDAKVAAEVTSAAKRVSIVTAVSPRAIIDIGYVLFENVRLIARIADVYGCRPGPIGFMRLLRQTLAHLAVTGVVAMGDTLVQQLVGHGIAARVSARLGEGVLNGVMTARVGLAAMDVTRPCPFKALPRPSITDIAAALKPGGG